MKKICTILLLFCGSHSIAQVELVKKVHMGTPAYSVNGKLLFAGLDEHDTYQLWISDGTETGTAILKSFYAGTGLSHGAMFQSDNGFGEEMYNPVVFNNELYFFANVAEVHHGIDLWKSDGTTAGTVYLGTFTNDFYGLNWSSNTVSFCVFNNALYFSCGDNTRGASLWKTDGGTPTKVFDLANGDYFWGPRYMTVFNNAMYFTASNGTNGVEIWKSDGTAAGTHMLKDIFPGANGVENNVSGFSVVKPQFRASGNYLYFTGYRNEDFNFYNLYRTDGTEAGTIRMDSTIYMYNVTSYLQPYQADANGTFLFMAYPGGVNVNTSGLFKSNGTVAGTAEVVTSNNLKAYGIFTSFQNKAYFAGVQGTGSATQYGLCVSDGTSVGTSMFYSFPTGSSDSYTLNFLNTGTTLFFRELMNFSTGASYRIAQTDGTTAGTKIHYGAVAWSAPVLHNGYIYFSGTDTVSTSSTDWGLYRSLPVPESTLPVTLTAFTAMLAGNNQVLLNWQTAGEIKSRGFDVERSTDGVQFAYLGFVPAAGQSSSLLNYSFTDPHPVEGINYYRLKQNDTDGQYTYSDARKIEISTGNSSITINPNPVSGNTIILKHHLPAGNVLVQVKDITGRTLSARIFNTGNSSLAYDIHDLPAGIYFLTVFADRQMLHTARFIKQ